MKSPKIAIILIAVGVIGLFAVTLYSPSYSAYTTSGFKSNGERIYFTATSNSGKPIISSIGTMAMRGMMSCAACHGVDGKGGRGRMMMWTFDASDIRYSTLTAGGGNETPYTDELIKRAITQGVDADGKRLEPPMPVWQMSDSDLNDLLEYLKSLK
ncbi:MAG: cytochrome c [Candidatus Methanoperedens sp.]|nr:cytochrome c [Candidatus Methanoperedens sp.]MCZ7396410.1 cytochrome c [Candidatus Methanoperedens sp.]